MLHVRSLGDASPTTPPACGPGFYPAPAKCPEYDTFKIVSDPNGSGCQRCEKKTAAEGSSDYCIRAIQFYFQGQGQLSVASVTGTWNDETRRVLAMRLGPSWESYPGGACGILASLGTGVIPQQQPYYGGGYPGAYGYQQPSPFSSITPTTMLLLGGAALALVLVLRRN